MGVSTQELKDWRYQCEERLRRWADGRVTPEWSLGVRNTLALLNDLESTRAESAKLAARNKELRSALAQQKNIAMGLLELTRAIDEHPEDYDGPCFCQLCCSYGDVADDGGAS